MKRIISRTLCVALTIAILLIQLGCATKTDSVNQDIHTDIPVSTSTILDSPYTDITPGPKNTSNTTTEPTTESTTPITTPEPTTVPVVSDKFNTNANLVNTVNYDSNDVTISVDKLEYSNSYATITFTLENKSEKDLSFTSSYRNSINGYMLDICYIYETVAAGKKAIVKEDLYYRYLQRYGINEVADLEIIFEVENSDDWQDSFYTSPIIIETSAKSNHDYSIQYIDKALKDKTFEKYIDGYHVVNYSDSLLINSNNVELRSPTIIKYDDEDYFYLLFQVTNNSDTEIVTNIYDISIDSLTAYKGLWYHNTILPHKTRIVEIDLSNTSICDKKIMDLLNITSYEEVGFIMNVDTQDNTQIFTKPVSFKISGSSAPDLKGITVYDSNNIVVTYKGMVTRGSDDKNISPIFFVKNNRESAIYIYEGYDKSSINGFMQDLGLWNSQVDPGETIIWSGRIYGSDLESLNITDPINEISELEFLLELEDSNYTDIDNKTVTVKIKWEIEGITTTLLVTVKQFLISGVFL